jgi:hypothetical protein
MWIMVTQRRAGYWPAMPRYFFHVFNDDVTIDEEGQDFTDQALAHARALREARELMAETVRTGRIVLSHRIAVDDAEGRRLFEVTFGDALDIKE